MPRQSYVHDSALVEAIEHGVRAGASLADAAGAQGLGHSAVNTWRQRGERELARLAAADDAEPDPTEAPFAAFAERVRRAEHEAKVEALAVIRRAIVGWDEEETRTVEKCVALLDADGRPQFEGDGVTVRMVVVSRTTTKTSGRKFAWAAAMTWLERRYPREFARLMRTELTGAEGGPLAITDIDAVRARALEVVDQVAERRRVRDIAAQRAIEGNGHAAAE